jgi:hypothetical protein
MDNGEYKLRDSFSFDTLEICLPFPKGMPNGKGTPPVRDGQAKTAFGG